MRTRLRTAPVLLALALCSGAAVAGAPSAAAPEAVPVPSLAGMAEAVREQLTGARAELEAVLAEPVADTPTRAAGYGELGRLYLAYDLVEPAAACLRNAWRLAPDEPAWPYLLGGLYQNERRLEEAAEAFAATLALAPDDPPALVRQGNVLLALGRPEAARPLFERALATGAVTAAAWAGLGKAAAAAGEHEAAVEHFEAALATQPEASSLRYPLAMAYRELGDTDAARAQLELRGAGTVAFRDPRAEALLELTTGAGVHLMLGTRALRQGELETAVARYRSALAADPRDAAAHQALGAALSRQGDLDGAVRHYSAALAIEPRNPALHYNLGTVLVEQGSDEQAIRHFRAALAQAPDYHNARFNLAAALARGDRLEEALAEYRRLREEAPEDDATTFYLAQTLHRLGRHAEAGELFAVLATEDPARARARIGLAATLAARGEAAAAAAELEAVTELATAAPELKADAYSRLAGVETERAAEHYRSALALDPDWRPALGGLAGVLAAEGQEAEAVALFDRLVELSPGDDFSRRRRALLLLLSGEWGEARRRLEEDVAALPGSAEPSHLLARLLATCPEPELRDGERALEIALALFSAGKRPGYAETVAMALAELGRFAEAVEWQRRLILETERVGESGSLPRLRERLALYESGRPLHGGWPEVMGAFH